MCLFKDMSVRVFHGGNECENNRLKQKAGDKMGKCVRMCVCVPARLCPHVCDSAFIYRSPLGAVSLPCYGRKSGGAGLDASLRWLHNFVRATAH